MFFSVVMQFVYSLEEKKTETTTKKKKKKKKNRIWGWRGRVERDKSRGTGWPNSSGGQQGTPVKNNRRGPNIIK